MRKLIEYTKNNIFKFTTLGLLIGIVGVSSYSITYCKLVEKRANDLYEENMSLKNTLSQSDLVTVAQAESNQELKDIIDQMSNQQEKLASENKKLDEANQKLSKQVKKFQKRKELFNKYEYAIMEDGYRRTDLTYSQIKTGEELMKEKGYDPNLLFGIIMVESSATENMTSEISTARGYGQILEGTGSFIYNTLLKNPDKYHHSYAFDGKLNMIMMTEYIDYLLKNRDYNLYKAIQGYRGKENVTPYISGINKYIKQSGTSIKKIANEIKQNKLNLEEN